MPQTSTFESCRVIPSMKKSTLFYFGMSTGISFFGTGPTECIAPENRGKPGTKTGDRRDVPQHPHGRYSSKLNSLCRSLIAFDGRPPFCGAKVLSVVFSKSRTNSSVPNGRQILFQKVQIDLSVCLVVQDVPSGHYRAGSRDAQYPLLPRAQILPCLVTRLLRPRPPLPVHSAWRANEQVLQNPRSSTRRQRRSQNRL